MEKTDLELISRIHQGDRSCADELVRRHLGRVRNLIFPLVLDHDLADDLTQDVFAKVFKSLTTFRGESAFDTWIHRIAVNVTYGHLRQSRLRKTSAVLVDVVDTDAVPSSRVLESEQRDRLADALASLKPALRTAIVLTVLQGMTAIEAAEIEKCSVGTMYWRIHQARQALKAALKDWLP